MGYKDLGQVALGLPKDPRDLYEVDKNPSIYELGNLSPEQASIMRGYNTNILPMLSGYGERLERLSRPAYNYDQGAFNDFYQSNVEQPMRQRYREEILPTIMSKGSPWGSVNLKQRMKSLEDLSNSLASQKAGINMQFMDKQAQQMNMARERERLMSPENILMGLMQGPQKENVVMPQQQGILGGIFGGQGLAGLF